MVEKSLSTENPFDQDSENEHHSKSKSNSHRDEFTSSLLLKTGRTANTTLYFPNYNRLPNNGNGLDRDERNSLQAAMQTTQEAKRVLDANMNQIKKETTSLISEPLNESLDGRLVQMEEELEDLSTKLERLRAYGDNATKRKKTQKSIERMSTLWRKRRRLTMDFLIRMEECTEGTITVKKVLKGDSAIEVESDECHLKGMMAWTKAKQQRNSRNGGMRKSFHDSNGCDVDSPNENFVGLLMDKRGRIQRVQLDEDE